MEFEFTIPDKPLNTSEFAKDNPGYSLFQRGDKLVITGDCTQAQAQAMLDAHNPPAPTEPTVADKLASVGLNLEDLKEALGL